MHHTYNVLYIAIIQKPVWFLVYLKIKNYTNDDKLSKKEKDIKEVRGEWGLSDKWKVLPHVVLLSKKSFF